MIRTLPAVVCYVRQVKGEIKRKGTDGGLREEVDSFYLEIIHKISALYYTC